MKFIHDVVLDELTNRASEHVPRQSIHGPNTHFTPNPMTSAFYIHSNVLAKCSDGQFRGGFITGMTTALGSTTYRVRLHEHHGARTIETNEVQ